MAKYHGIPALFSFEGRTRRRDWWLIGIGLTVLHACSWAVLRKLIFGSWPSLLEPVISRGEAALALSLSMAFLWPVTALSMRRAHDRNKSGWLVLVSAAFMIAEGIAALVVPDFMSAPMVPPFSVWDLIRHLLTSASLIITVWLLVTLGFLDGTPGPNRHGQSPKGIDQKPEASPPVG